MIINSVNSIESILMLIEKYGILAVAVVVLALLAWFYIKRSEKRFDKLFEKIMEKSKDDDEHVLTKEKMEGFVENAQKIQQMIYHILNEFEADRVSIFEYHNGGKTINGVDFKKCSNTYEALDLGIESKYKDYQNIPISINFLWSKLLMDKKIMSINDIKNLKDDDFTIYSILKSLEIKSYYSILILDYDNKPIGFIEIVYHKKQRTLNSDELNFFNNSALQICGLLKK